MRLVAGFRIPVTLVALLVLSGCASYTPKPLPDGPDLRAPFQRSRCRLNDSMYPA